MPYTSSQAPQNPQPLTAANSASINTTAPIFGCLIIVVSLSLVMTFLGYKKYRVRQRSRLLKRQVAMLEAMWRISSTK